MSEYLFLYGTLLPGDATDESSRIVRRLKRVGSATIRGRLYDFGEYPGAVLDRTAKSSIKGELFELPNDDSALKALDDYEEFNRTDRKNSLFVRTRTVATLQGGRPAKCLGLCLQPQSGKRTANRQWRLLQVKSSVAISTPTPRKARRQSHSSPGVPFQLHRSQKKLPRPLRARRRHSARKSRRCCAGAGVTPRG
jgi:gamma-glutamylcyclotransferase (GGCT)/AIG2-like uncharacterized protein YtfP